MSESSEHIDQEQGLRTEPSFCIYSADDDKFVEEAENMDKIKYNLERSATIGDTIEAEFSFGKNGMRSIEEDEDEDGKEEDRASNRFDSPKIEVRDDYMNSPAKGGGGEEAGTTKLMNYARYLESTTDLSGAEEYYIRAIQADPKDGEILSEYAKVVWQLHGDQARASRYFEKAAEAAPQDSNVLAAYASFLWDIDEDEEERSSKAQGDENYVKVVPSAMDFKEEMRPSSPPLHLAMGLGINDTGFGIFNSAFGPVKTHPDESGDVEEYHRKMVEENPHNPLFLKNYDIFLHQEKGDMMGAEEYYSRGILEDPHDAQMLSSYAGILWLLYHDKDRAGAYFERAIKVNPDDSDVLAAYAKFLWEVEEEDNDDIINEV